MIVRRAHCVTRGAARYEALELLDELLEEKPLEAPDDELPELLDPPALELESEPEPDPDPARESVR